MVSGFPALLKSEDLQIVAVLDEPDPSRPKEREGGLGELVFELVEGSERPLHEVGGAALRLAAAVGGEAAPIERMVPDLGGVVEDTGLWP